MSGSSDRRPSGADQGAVRPLPPGVIAGFLVVGLVVGYVVRRVLESWGQVPPGIAWIQVVMPFFAALVLAVVGRDTWRAVRSRVAPLDFQRAVNRLVLARASALVAALVTGGYAGYAISWLWVDADFARLLVLKAGLAALGSVGMLAAALFLQRACRVEDTPGDAESGGR